MAGELDRLDRAGSSGPYHDLMPTPPTQGESSLRATIADLERAVRELQAERDRQVARRRRGQRSRLDRYRAEIESLARAGASSYDIALWLRKFKRTRVHPTTVWWAPRRWRRRGPAARRACRPPLEAGRGSAPAARGPTPRPAPGPAVARS